jgi:hypothetical protein
MATGSVTGTIGSTTTAGTITIQRGLFNLSLWGTWTATVVLQRSFDGGTTWLDVETYTANTEDYGDEPEDNAKYRLNVTYTSGTINYRIGQVHMASYR